MILEMSMEHCARCQTCSDACHIYEESGNNELYRPTFRSEVMRRIFGADGANFSLARSTIGSTDFSVEGKYSYAPVEGDTELQHFSIAIPAKLGVVSPVDPDKLCIFGKMQL